MRQHAKHDSLTRIRRALTIAVVSLLLAGPAFGQDEGPADPVADSAAADPVAASDPVDPVADSAPAIIPGEAAGPTSSGDPIAEEAMAGSLDYSLFELIQFGGVIGYAILFLSLVTVALMIDNGLLLRRKNLIPPGEVEELREVIRDGDYESVTARTPSSFVGVVTAAGVGEADRGYEAVVKAMEDSADELTARLLRRIEHLNIIANVAPMLGLLGTVVGMVKSFNQISVAAGGADPRLLAAGIFQALMTTVMGLTVAIPTLFVYGMLRNRVDGLAADASATAEQLVAPLRDGPAEPARLRRLARV